MDRVLSIRVPTELAKDIASLAAQRGTTATRIMRMAIWAGLNPPALAPWSYGVANPDVGVIVSVMGHEAGAWTGGAQDRSPIEVLN
jgi:predicted transcriptional regulator